MPCTGTATIYRSHGWTEAQIAELQAEYDRIGWTLIVLP